MTKQRLFLFAAILILAGLILIVTGLERSTFLWLSGLGLVAVAMLLSLLSRWISDTNSKEED